MSLDAILAALETRFGPCVDGPTPLVGGITNHNVRVRLGEEDLVLRLPGPDTELLGIDREREQAATASAGALGLGAELVAYLPEHRCLVTRFAEGEVCEAADLRAGLPAVAALLRRVHAEVDVRGTFSAFATVEAYAERARARGVELPGGYAEAAPVAAAIAVIAHGPEHAAAACHNDLLSGNVLRTRDGLRLLDWEYAGRGDPYFDLANLAANNGFDDDDDARLLEAYFGAATPARVATLALMRVMSDLREAMWAVLQGALSPLDFDFDAYAAEHFARVQAQAARPELGTWLAAARHTGWDVSR
jgi:thiamine kinase-like enzyme